MSPNNKLISRWAFLLLFGAVMPAVVLAQDPSPNDDTRPAKVISGYSGRRGMKDRGTIYDAYLEQQQLGTVDEVPAIPVRAPDEGEYERVGARRSSQQGARRSQNRDRSGSEDYAAGSRRRQGDERVGGRAAIQYPDQQERRVLGGNGQVRKQARGDEDTRGGRQRLSLDMQQQASRRGASSRRGQNFD